MNRNKVFAVAFSFPPDSGSGSIRNIKILKYLPECGWQLRVLTHSANEAKLRESENLMKQIPESVSVLRVPYADSHQLLGKLKELVVRSPQLTKPSVESSAMPASLPTAEQSSPPPASWGQRLKDKITFCLSVPDKQASWIPLAFARGLISCLGNRPRVIYAIGKPWSCFLVGYLLKRVLFLPLILDFMDPWNGPSWGGRKGTRVDLFLERFACRRADFIITNTSHAQEDIVNRLGITADRVGVLTCGYDEADFSTVPPIMSKREASPFIITHTGSFYSKRSPAPFLSALKTLLDAGKVSPDGIRVHFIGPLALEDADTQALLKDSLIDQVLHRKAWVPHDEAIQIMHDSDALLLVQPETRLQIPAKLYEYAASRKPILALAETDGAVAQMVENQSWGTVVPSENVALIACALEEMLDQHAHGNLTPLSDASIALFSTRSLANQLAEILDRAAYRNPTSPKIDHAPDASPFAETNTANQK